MRYVLFFVLLSNLMMAQVPTTGLIHNWPFSGNANDVIGTNHGTVMNATLTADRFGNPNCAYKFNGSSSYIVMPSAGLTGTVSRSVSFWGKTNSTSLTAAFCYGGAPSSFAIQFWYGCSGIGFDNGAGAYIKSNSNVANGQWHHYVAVYNSTVSTLMSSVDFYMDGVLLSSLGCTIGSTVAAINTTSTFPINIGKVSDNNIRFFNGDLDDFFFYNRALSPTEVLALYNDVSCAGTPPQPATINGNAVVCAGSTVVYSVSPVAGATSYTWTLPGGWTGTSTTNTISVIAGTLSGQMAVAAKNCCGASQPVTLDVNASPCTGINESINKANKFIISPNPNKGSFNLESAVIENAKLEIYNSLGQIVYSKQLEKPEEKIETKLSVGIYFVLIRIAESVTESQRLVITE